MARQQIRSSGLSPAARITREIIARLEAGTRPWIRPWREAAASRPLRACGTPYRGINTFWLWMMAETCGYTSPYWMTFNQARRLGAQVKKGEKAAIAIFYRSYTKAIEVPETGETSEEARRVLKAYPVFSANQIDGLPEHFHPAAPREILSPDARTAALDAFFARIPAQLRHQGDQAYYEPVADRITLPPVDLFDGFDHYYATLAHELSHWTGHPSRLDRDLAGRFGAAAYAAEELIAELSSAILGAELGLPVSHLDNHASYIAHWLQLLQDDDRAILTAAARAEEASGLLLKLGRPMLAGRDPDPSITSYPEHAFELAQAAPDGKREERRREAG